MSARIIVDLIEEASKYVQLSPDKADPLQLALRTQWANNDRFPQYVKHLFRLRAIANTARSPKVRKVLLRFVYTYFMVMVSQSSVQGRFIKLVHSKKEEISLTSKDLKSMSMKDRIMENKANRSSDQEDSREYSD